MSLFRKNSGIAACSLYLLLLGFVWLLLLAARLLFALFFQDAAQDAAAGDILKGLYLGMRFDGRIAAILVAPLGFLLTIPFFSRRLRSWKKGIFRLYFAVFLCLWTVFALDFGFYAYLGERLNAVLFELLEDVGVSLRMVWQSYPVVLITLGVFLASLTSAYGVSRLAGLELRHCSGKKTAVASWLAAFAVFAWAVYGQVSSNLFPLRWSNAYFSPNPAVTALGLNPVQNLYDTYRASQEDGYDAALVREAYPLIADYLRVDVPDVNTLEYSRRHEMAGGEGAERPNIVIIIMESMGHQKSSFAPGEDDPTPFLKRLAGESLYYPLFFSNTRTTARAVFTTMTGIPDVTESSTGSRNPFVVDQRLLADQFAGYDKYYMLGGNTNWANIRGVLGNNIQGLNILEESSWKASNVDVWGISDWDLLMESHDLFASLNEKPFLAVIQTASFHKPFTVPDTPGFEKKNLPDETRRNYGFVSEDEYNSMRYVDYALEEFFRRARQAPYYRDTIFFLFGDHGIKDPSRNMDAAYTAADLAPWHVPLIIHAPGRVLPGLDEKPASQVDVFPTAAALAGISHTNWTLGRDLLDKRFEGDRLAFISGQSSAPIRLLREGYCYFDNRGGRVSLYRLGDDPAVDYRQAEPERFAAMRELARAFQNTAKYMLYNNKKAGPREKTARPQADGPER